MASYDRFLNSENGAPGWWWEEMVEEPPFRSQHPQHNDTTATNCNTNKASTTTSFIVRLMVLVFMPSTYSRLFDGSSTNGTP